MPKAKNLKYLRTKSGLTQEVLADVLGVTIKTIRSWEHRDTAIPTPATRRIANYFGVSFMDFCDIDLEHMDTEMADVDLRLSAQEAHNIILFRKLDETTKQVIRELIVARAAYMEGRDG